MARILIVEDEKKIARFLELELKHEGYEVLTAFDGRSGPPIIDWYVPNLGSLEERALWWMHDCLGYGESLDFWHTNRALRLGLRDQAGYRATKAWAIERAVSISKSWYGTPEPDDWCYNNITKVSTLWIPAT